MTHPTLLHVSVFGGAILAVVALFVLSGMPAVAALVRRWLPRALAGGLAAAAVYAFFLRQPGGRLAVHDANSLRTFTWYLHPAGLAAAVLGFVLVAWRRFWRDPAFLLLAAVSACFVFYKIQIVPQHFWMARRFVAVIMPAALLFATAAVFAGFSAQALRVGEASPFPAAAARVTRVAIRLIVLVLLASSLLQATRAILPHVEYAGVVPRIEALSRRFGDQDLVVVESRNASDLHVLALPLAYIYARNVLVLANPKPDKALFAGSSSGRARGTGPCTSWAAAAPTSCRAATASPSRGASASRCPSTSRPATRTPPARGRRSSISASTGSRRPNRSVRGSRSTSGPATTCTSCASTRRSGTRIARSDGRGTSPTCPSSECRPMRRCSR